MRRQTFSKGDGAAVSFMPRSINRQLMKYNPRLLHVERARRDHQPMVEKMADRLRQLKGDLSYEAFGALAGVSAQSVQKWMAGGNVKDATLRKLLNSEHFKGRGITLEWIRYGDTIAATKAQEGGLSQLALEVARQWTELSEDRRDWFRDLIFTMRFVEKRFPAMRKGRPRGESYTNMELAFERDMRQLKLKLE
jgi:transcriptional regulator with XRE-family HTH domain